MSAREYYEVLELQPFSDGATVDQAYWHLAKTYQTQAVADPRARLLLDELNEAYGVLGTPRLREDYDSHLAERPQHARAVPRRTAKRNKTNPKAQGLRLRLPVWNPFDRGRTPVEGSVSKSIGATPRAELAPARRQKSDVSDLRASTSQMIERWRTNADANRSAASTAPDMTLVDIFTSEKDVGSHEEPLAAVMEILKAPRDVLPVHADA